MIKTRMRHGLPLLTLAAALAAAAPASAAFPGANGRIAFYYPGTEGGILTMNPDGSDRRRLLDDPGAVLPAWSPDGRKIAYAWDGMPSVSGPKKVFVMNADGSGQTQLTASGEDEVDPACRPTAGRSCSRVRQRTRTPARFTPTCGS